MINPNFDLYTDLQTEVNRMVDKKQVSVIAGKSISNELTDAMWHTPNQNEVHDALLNVAAKYELPLPPESFGVDIDAILARHSWESDDDAA